MLTEEEIKALNDRRREALYFLRPELAQAETPRPGSDIRKVLEVEDGRPKVAAIYDPEGGHGVVEFVEGYRRPSGAKHEYDPMAGLRREDD